MKRKLFEHRGGNVFVLTESPMDEFEMLLEEGKISQAFMKLPMYLVAGIMLASAPQMAKGQDADLDKAKEIGASIQQMTAGIGFQKMVGDIFEQFKDVAGEDDVKAVLDKIVELKKSTQSGTPQESAKKLQDALKQLESQYGKRAQEFSTKGEEAGRQPGGSGGALQKYLQTSKKFEVRRQLTAAVQISLKDRDVWDSITKVMQPTGADRTMWWMSK